MPVVVKEVGVLEQEHVGVFVVEEEDLVVHRVRATAIGAFEVHLELVTIGAEVDLVVPPVNALIAHDVRDDGNGVVGGAVVADGVGGAAAAGALVFAGVGVGRRGVGRRGHGEKASEEV